MISSCRLQYKSYTDENTHIHVLLPDCLSGKIAVLHLLYVCEVQIYMCKKCAPL
jgi:hypothetical protein